MQTTSQFRVIKKHSETWKDLLNNTMSIEYNDFGFTAMDADELASVDTKIIEKTTSATEVVNKMDNFIRPLLENLMKDSDKDYIYWPNRTEILQKKIQELNSLQDSL